MDAYVAALVAVFRAVRRVLRPDGTLWLNLGDSYGGVHEDRNGQGSSAAFHGTAADPWAVGTQRKHATRQNSKQLLGIPWRVALALQADGWVLRSDIIWAKPNAMPESVTDRPTKAHEYLFLLAPGPRYYYDAAAIAEPTILDTRQLDRDRINRGDDIRGRKQRCGSAEDGTRNKRTVWNIPTRGYSQAHFATFPPDLIRPCVLAGTSAAGQCAACGHPWARVVTRIRPTAEDLARVSYRKTSKTEPGMMRRDGEYAAGRLRGQEWNALSANITTGWQPTCRCEMGDPVPQTVLDPFNGAGTTGVVALAAGRAYIGCELNAEYLTLTRARLATVQPRMQEVA